MTIQMNVLLLSRCSNVGYKSITISNRSFLSPLYSSHCNRKWSSSSTGCPPHVLCTRYSRASFKIAKNVDTTSQSC